MKYPLEEKIGDAELLVGREKEFNRFDKWINNIPRKLSKSRVILARRKSGKTTFVQRIFNRLWSENGPVIPFYLDIPESKIWYPLFAMDYYRAFASQYISFLERDEELVRNPLPLRQIRKYGLEKSIKVLVSDVDSLKEDMEAGYHDLIWKTAYTAPKRFAALHDQRILVIIDEFQNITKYVYRDEQCERNPDETLAGSFHSTVESKMAPMLVTGSYIRWLTDISDKYLEAGRLTEIYMKPHLTLEEGLRAVYKYAEFYREPITNETAILINRLCMSDPFFIANVIQNEYEDRDLTTGEGVVNTVNYEITDRRSEMSRTWREYIYKTLRKVNDRNGKRMLLHLSKHSDRYWTPKQIKDELGIDLDEDEIQEKLHLLVEADVIEWGSSDIQFRGLRDGTLNLILRNRFEEEIEGFVPDLKQEFNGQIRQLEKENRSLQGMLNNLSGKFAENLGEYQLTSAFRTRKRFSLSDFFSGVEDEAELNIIDVRQRVPFQRGNGKGMEFDVVAESKCSRVVVVEVRKRKPPTGLKPVEDFHEKVKNYATFLPDKTILPAFLSLGGFTVDAGEYCKEHGIGTAQKIEHF